MRSLHLTCSPERVEEISAELWDAGTLGVEEVDLADQVLLIACFEKRDDSLLSNFAPYRPEWGELPAINWIEETHRGWPPRQIGGRLFLAVPWCTDPTPHGRTRVLHNPSQASGTGEHPCTQLALAALEKFIQPGSTVADIGTGSGIVSMAALRLGAARAIAVDTDENALLVARENFSLNGLEPSLVCGSANCLSDQIADVTVANINATVLLSIMDELLRITRPMGRLILTGFPSAESHVVRHIFPEVEFSMQDGWCSIVAALS